VSRKAKGGGKEEKRGGFAVSLDLGVSKPLHLCMRQCKMSRKYCSLGCVSVVQWAAAAVDFCVYAPVRPPKHGGHSNSRLESANSPVYVSVSSASVNSCRESASSLYPNVTRSPAWAKYSCQFVYVVKLSASQSK